MKNQNWIIQTGFSIGYGFIIFLFCGFDLRLLVLNQFGYILIPLALKIFTRVYPVTFAVMVQIPSFLSKTDSECIVPQHQKIDKSLHFLAFKNLFEYSNFWLIVIPWYSRYWIIIRIKQLHWRWLIIECINWISFRQQFQLIL